MLKSIHPCPKPRGFTLAEMAIVVVLAGIMLTMGLKMTVANLNNGAYAETASKQAQIKLALLGYLRSNGALPCPDMTVSPATPNGFAAATCTGAAAAAYGIVPWNSLYLTRETAQDGWGNYFYYRVANGLPSTVKNWTSTTLASPFDINELATPNLAIKIQQRDPVTFVLSTVTSNAVAVIFSGGKNGFGTQSVQGKPNGAPPASNLDELFNLGKFNNGFRIRPYTEVNVPGAGPFDELIVYLTPRDLLQPLFTEQTLLSCRAYCSPANPPGPCTVIVPAHIPVGNPTPNCP